MRFKASEYKDFQALITKEKLDPLDFSNVKKKGRLTVYYKDGASFTFFRRTTMELDADKQWTRMNKYEVGPAKALIADGLEWAGVLKHFKKWLKSL